MATSKVCKPCRELWHQEDSEDPELHGVSSTPPQDTPPSPLQCSPETGTFYWGLIRIWSRRPSVSLSQKISRRTRRNLTWGVWWTEAPHVPKFGTEPDLTGLANLPLNENYERNLISRVWGIAPAAKLPDANLFLEFRAFSKPSFELQGIIPARS